MKVWLYARSWGCGAGKVISVSVQEKDQSAGNGLYRRRRKAADSHVADDGGQTGRGGRILWYFSTYVYNSDFDFGIHIF